MFAVVERSLRFSCPCPRFGVDFSCPGVCRRPGRDINTGLSQLASLSVFSSDDLLVFSGSVGNFSCLLQQSGQGKLGRTCTCASWSSMKTGHHHSRITSSHDVVRAACYRLHLEVSGRRRRKDQL